MKKTLISALLIALTGTAQAAIPEAGSWLVRAGSTTVAPDDSSSNVFVGGADLGIGVSVDNNTQLGLNLAYFVSDNVSVELLAATPFQHEIELNSVGQLADIKHLPPSVTVNYYMMDKNSVFQPYVGAGLNYTVFFDEEFTSANRDAGFSDLDLDSSFGLTAQLGMDYHINDSWHVNASARWIDIDTDATFKAGGVEGSVSVDIDPWVYSVMVGYTF
ncbi:outer membrane beta-barrel protein [Aestuariibacter sp. AA17]|uniref:Outer membrane beta-barrel protein n=1 Tax=Fluctibacter corallii TaxID=2984329 RepID=A0ABT3AAI0_9ALTE|nr:OmpW family outer membrane protein [Aestuariibacter sp. AA17]MCV2885664.1 outer membrane beta-barrel protein [Aestuariibacter sp. AA17]